MLTLGRKFSGKNKIFPQDCLSLRINFPKEKMHLKFMPKNPASRFVPETIKSSPRVHLCNHGLKDICSVYTDVFAFSCFPPNLTEVFISAK